MNRSIPVEKRCAVFDFSTVGTLVCHENIEGGMGRIIQHERIGFFHFEELQAKLFPDTNDGLTKTSIFQRMIDRKAGVRYPKRDIHRRPFKVGIVSHHHDDPFILGVELFEDFRIGQSEPLRRCVFRKMQALKRFHNDVCKVSIEVRPYLVVFFNTPFGECDTEVMHDHALPVVKDVFQYPKNHIAKDIQYPEGQAAHQESKGHGEVIGDHGVKIGIFERQSRLWRPQQRTAQNRQRTAEPP